jgi:hypothetical protein
MSTLNEVIEDPRAECRVPAELKAVIQVKEGDGVSWKEVADISTVSRNGAGFSLSKPCVVGRLITIVLPLPRELRAYDHDKDLYPVMAIIQYCNEGMMGDEKVFHVGAGFVGKTIPDSFKIDPTQNYRITGMNKEGLWEITESGRQFQNRKKPRYWVSLPISLSLINKEDKSIRREETFTKNVGAGGLSIATALNPNVGDKIKVACKPLDFYAIGVVRNLTPGDSPTVHLEFMEDEFPIEKVISMQAAA